MDKPGPFKAVSCVDVRDGEELAQAPIRQYSCPNYSSCLNITAALNWDSFTCEGCNGEIDKSLNWQAHLAQKKDNVADRICEIPPIGLHEPDEDLPDPRKVANKG